MIGIYKITNKVSGKFYVGRSRNILERWYAHIYALNCGKHPNRDFQKEFISYEIGNFTFEILELCKVAELKNQELVYLNKLNFDKLAYNVVIDDPIPFEQLISYQKRACIEKVFYKLHSKNPKIVEIPEDLIDEILKLVDNDLELYRSLDEVLIIPNKFKDFRKAPYIYLQQDIQE